MKCLAPQLSDRRVSISLPSLRAEAFSVGLADAVSEVRKSGFTFAPETGSDRLRRVINKTFTNADMIAAADVAFARGWDLIKVYTMIGLPTETDADLDELVDARRGHPRAGSQARPQERQRLRRLLRAEVLDAVPVGALRRRRRSLERKLAYLKDRFRSMRGAKMKWHEPREAEIECVLSRGDRRAGRILHTAWKSGVRFDGWTEHFRYDLWMKAFETEGIPKESYLRAYDLDEILPWDVLDVSIKKRWLQIELIKAKKEMRTEDCKWGHCYACGVPGNGEDTVLAKPMAGDALPAFDAADGARRAIPPPTATSPRAPRTAQKAMPDLPSASRARGDQGDRVFRHRITFSKTGDARLLSHRNTMDVLERAIRAAGLPARYSEGFNPHMKLSMGPALALGLESRHEVFDVEADRAVSRRRGRAHQREAAGRHRRPRGPRARRRASRRSRRPSRARATPCGSSPRSTSTAPASALADGWREAMPALRALSLEADAAGASLRFEVNLDQSAGETATAKKVLETLLAIPPDGAGRRCP